MSAVLMLSRRNLVSNRARFVLTTLSVMMGVAFVVASFVLSDGLRSTFDSIVEDTNAATDAQVRAASDFDEVDFGVQSFDEEALDVVRSVEGVGAVQPWFQSLKVIPTKENGEPLETFGPPILALNWLDTALSSIQLEEGEEPDEPGEFALDLDTVDREGYELGQTYDVIGINGREPFTLVGTTRFGEDNETAGAVLAAFTLDEVRRLDGDVGKLHGIDVTAAPGTEPEALIEQLEAALPAGLEAVGADVVIEEDQEDFRVIVDVFGNVLLAFALITVFVSAFIIANTFNILLGQRVRQLALIRALGASPAQVRVGALLEATIVGLLACVLGLGAGVLLALGLRALMNALGLQLPNLEMVLAARTIIVAGVVGLGVTLLAALTPARRAAKVPPVAAMREGYRFGSGEGTRRTVTAVVLAVLGLAGIAMSLFGDPDNTALLLGMLGGGAVLVFIAVNMLTPLFSTPSARLLGAPLEHMPWLGVTGKMARENAARDNKQTARTAAGLVVGLALVAMATVVATSLKDSFRSSLGSTLLSDYLVTSDSGTGFSPELAAQIDALPEFVDVAQVRYGTIRVDGDERDVAATDLTLLTKGLDVEVVSGDPASSAEPGYVLVTDDVADDEGLAVGDTVNIEFAASGEQEFEVGAIYENDFLIGSWIIDLSSWDQNFTLSEDHTIAISLVDGVDEEQADAALAPLADSYPQLEFETRDEFRERLEGQLDSLLVIINVFLGLAIIIALMGITNTMALSVLERTREIGLMRAVGMTRSQTRKMIRWEAGVVSLFGALLGVVVGIGFGWLAVTAMPDSIVDRLGIPVQTLVLYVVIASVAGLIVASIPARRASRLKILEAIHEL